MSDKDVIIKIKGKTEKTVLAMNEIEQKLRLLGKEADTKTVSQIPIKIENGLLKTTKTKDICLNFSGKKENVKKVMSIIKANTEKELGIEPDYEMIKNVKELVIDAE